MVSNLCPDIPVQRIVRSLRPPRGRVLEASSTRGRSAVPGRGLRRPRQRGSASPPGGNPGPRVRLKATIRPETLRGSGGRRSSMSSDAATIAPAPLDFKPRAQRRREDGAGCPFPSEPPRSHVTAKPDKMRSSGAACSPPASAPCAISCVRWNGRRGRWPSRPGKAPTRARPQAGGAVQSGDAAEARDHAADDAAGRARGGRCASAAATAEKIRAPPATPKAERPSSDGAAAAEAAPLRIDDKTPAIV